LFVCWLVAAAAAADCCDFVVAAGAAALQFAWRKIGAKSFSAAETCGNVEMCTYHSNQAFGACTRLSLAAASISLARGGMQIPQSAFVLSLSR